MPIIKVCVIVNPVSGPAYLRPDLKKALALFPGFGWETKVLETKNRLDATEFARHAVEEGYDMVVACGGDGTINDVIQPLPGTGVALGIIPTGTANVFAHEMHIPLNPVEAATALASAQLRDIDVGVANSRYFLLWAGIGFDAEVILNIEPKAKRRYGIPAFIIAALFTALKFEGIRAEVVIDNLKLQRRILLVVLSNIKYYALFELAHEAKLDDGLLDVCLFEGRGLMTKLRHIVSLALRRHYRSPQVELYRAKALTVRTEKPLPVQVDGDVIGNTPITCRVEPRALKIALPKNSK